MRYGDCPFPNSKVVGGGIGAASMSVAISHSQGTYSGFSFPVQYLQDFALSVTKYSV